MLAYKRVLQVCTSWLGRGADGSGAAAQVTPEWERLTAHIEADPDSKRLLGCACPTGRSRSGPWCMQAPSQLHFCLPVLGSRHQAGAQ